jgi:hypothetical protein
MFRLAAEDNGERILVELIPSLKALLIIWLDHEVKRCAGCILSEHNSTSICEIQVVKTNSGRANPGDLGSGCVANCCACKEVVAIGITEGKDVHCVLRRNSGRKEENSGGLYSVRERMTMEIKETNDETMHFT